MQSFFESIKCLDKKAFYLKYHEKRIFDTVKLRIDLSKIIKLKNSNLIKCKIVYSENEILDITYDNYIIKNTKQFKIVYDDNISYKYKSTNRENIDLLLKQKNNKDEIIIVKNKLISDTSIANIAVYYKDEWLSPKKPLLNGTTIQRLVKEKKIKQADINIEMLKKATKIATLNAMIDFHIIDNYSIIY